MKIQDKREFRPAPDAPWVKIVTSVPPEVAAWLSHPHDDGESADMRAYFILQAAYDKAMGVSRG